MNLEKIKGNLKFLKDYEVILYGSHALEVLDQVRT